MHAIDDHISSDKFSTIEEVQTALELLEHDLPLVQLGLVQNFNRVYTIITRHVRGAHKKREFEHPDFLNQFDVSFANYYFAALQAYLHEQKVVPAWNRAFRTAERRRVSPFKLLILGVNAHVTNDIPQVLLDCHAGKKHYQDYVYVNTIINNALDEAIDSLAASEHPLHPQRLWLRPLYKPIMRILIVTWRWSAWRQYQRLIRHISTIEALERSADRKATLFSHLPV